MKKILICLISLLVLLNGIPLVGMAIESPEYVVNDQTVNVGDTFDVEVAIANNPGIISLRFKVNYDEEYLKLAGISNKGILNGYTTPSPVVSSPYTLRWADSLAVTDNNAEGTVVTLHFETLKSTDSTNVTIEHGEARNSMGKKVTFTNDTAVIRIKKSAVSVTGVSLNKENLSINTGESETLEATVIPDNATDKTVTWVSSDDNVAIVDSDGNVTAVGKGTAIITVTTEDGGYSDSCAVTVACSHSATTDYPAIESTCRVQGNVAYTKCDICGEVVSGSDEKLPFASHIGGNATCINKAVCEECGNEYGNLGEHNYEENTDEIYLVSEATCIEKAVYYKSCSVCGEANDETFEHGDADETNHIGDTFIENQKEATCYEDGYTGDVKCRSCNAVIEYGEAVSAGEHTPADVWSTDEDYHWKDCETVGCGNIIDKTAHSGGEASCKTKAVCDTCGVEYGKINSDNHTGETEIRNSIQATEEHDGYTGDTYCLECNQKIAEGEVIPKLPVTTDEPTTEEPTTEEPTTDESTTDESTTDESTTEEPTTDEPTTEEPTKEEPTTDEPTTEEPTTEEPTTEEPTTDEPTTDEPTTDEPVTDVPTTVEPATEVVTEGGEISTEYSTDIMKETSPEDTTAVSDSKSESKVPKTGDSLSVLMLCVVIAVSATGLCVINLFKKKNCIKTS